MSLKNSGVDFYDFDGNKLADNQYFAFLKSCGINYVRIRIWNNPYDENGNGYGGGNCDLQNAVTIGKLASENSMKVFADFHLSDFWTDPSQQRVPKDWSGFNLSQKQQAVYDYVFSSIETLKSNGAAAMSLSSFCVVTNALRLNLVKIYPKGIDKRSKGENIKMEVTLKVKGMMCPHCEARVKSALEEIRGVDSVIADHKKGTATVTLKEEVSIDTLKSAVKNRGYNVID